MFIKFLIKLNQTRELAAAYAVPCHIQNMASPYFAAAAAAANSARQHQMPAALSIFPTYQGSILFRKNFLILNYYFFKF